MAKYDIKITIKKAGLAFLYGFVSGGAVALSNGFNISDGVVAVVIGVIVGGLTGATNALKNYKA